MKLNTQGSKNYERFEIHLTIFIWTSFVSSKLLCHYLQSIFVFLFMFHLQTPLKFIIVDFWWINFAIRRKPSSLTSNNLFIGHSRQDWFVELDWWCLLPGKRLWIVQWKKYCELNSLWRNIFTFLKKNKFVSCRKMSII